MTILSFIISLCIKQKVENHGRAKVDLLYIDNGALLGWLIDPQQRRVEIYRQGFAVDVLENPAELSGEAVLPGFVLNLRRVWD
jgi:Uma2 family endonuclease